VSLVIDETTVERLLSKCPKQPYSITVCNIPMAEASESSERHTPLNISSTVPQSRPTLSHEESKARLLFFRNRIVQSGAALLSEDQLQRRIDEIKGRA